MNISEFSRIAKTKPVVQLDAAAESWLAQYTAAQATPHQPPPAAIAIDIAAYVALVALAGAAAWFSVGGMAVLFPGRLLSVVLMTVAMESSKLVTAAWLARRWQVTAWFWR